MAPKSLTRAERLRRVSERENLYAAILRFAALRPEGAPITAKDLLHAGPQQAITRALGDLMSRGRLMRIGRGLYVRPIETRLGKSPPPVEHVVHAISQVTGEVIALHGAASAKNLGLTPHAPARTIYLTTGTSRKMTLGDQTIEFRHAPEWQLKIPVRRAGNVIRALAWLGPAKAKEAVATLERRLPSEAIAELDQANAQLPAWLADLVGALVNSLRRAHQ